MKIITLWVGAFWFALLHHLSKNHPDLEFFAYEKDEKIVQSIEDTRMHPYFFPWVVLWKNVTLQYDLENISEFDLILLAIPAQFVKNTLLSLQDKLKWWVILLNVAKGIDHTSGETIWDMVEKIFSQSPHIYAVLSGGMIAGEVVDGKKLWADIACRNPQVGEVLKQLFESKTLEIHLTTYVKNTELFWSVKNIFALYMGYLEWKKEEMSTIGYYFTKLLEELPYLLKKLGGESEIDFGNFALMGDLIATCFGNSRNRYFWNLVWAGKTPKEAEIILQQEKKHAEWYETLRGLEVMFDDDRLPYFRQVRNVFYEPKK